METREPDWKFSPDEGMLNCLYASEGTEAGTVNIKLNVRKPGCDPWSQTVTVRSTLEHVRQGIAALGDKWIQIREKPEGNIYTAKRIITIPGTAEVVIWRINHTDVNGDKTAYKIEDSLKVTLIE